MQNSGFPDKWLYELKQKNNIVSVIERYIHLEKKGGRYWACCPFHNEKTPSFAINEDEGFYHCFGCKESGDVISFVMKYESCDFLEAIEILAKNAHMEVPKFTGETDIFEKKTKKDRIIKLLNSARTHYQENVYLPQAKAAQDYIKCRNFTKKDLDSFKIGYSINGFEIINHLKKQGFSEEEMLEAGLISKKEDRVYDINSKRLVFPIFNSFNECIGFSSRVLDSSLPKYINTPETLVFHKGKVVFGINLVKALKQQGKLDKIIIVEGQIDVISMHRAGFDSTVACMGTALTKENAHELKKLSENVILCFDGDTAGEKATRKSIDILKEEGFNVKIVALPNKHDPDEILKQNGREYMTNLIDSAVPTTDYLISSELAKFDLNNPEEKGKFISNALEDIAKIEIDSSQEPYLEKLRNISGVPIDILRRDIQKLKKGQISEKEKKDEGVLISRENGNIRAVKFILASLIYKKDFVNKKLDYKKLLPNYGDIIDKASEGITISSYFDYFDVENYPILKESIEFNFEEIEDNGQRYFDECVWSIAMQVLSQKQMKISEEFRQCEDSQKRAELAKELQATLKAIREKNLEEFYGRD